MPPIRLIVAYDQANEQTKGATVYITGRKLETLQATATELGKNCRPIVCDHAEADQIEKLFDQIRKNIIFLLWIHFYYANNIF